MSIFLDNGKLGKPSALLAYLRPMLQSHRNQSIDSQNKSIGKTNQLTGFYMIATLLVPELSFSLYLAELSITKES